MECEDWDAYYAYWFWPIELAVNWTVSTGIAQVIRYASVVWHVISLTDEVHSYEIISPDMGWFDVCQTAAPRLGEMIQHLNGCDLLDQWHIGTSDQWHRNVGLMTHQTDALWGSICWTDGISEHRTNDTSECRTNDSPDQYFIWPILVYSLSHAVESAGQWAIEGTCSLWSDWRG